MKYFIQTLLLSLSKILHICNSFDNERRSWVKCLSEIIRLPKLFNFYVSNNMLFYNNKIFYTIIYVILLSSVLTWQGFGSRGPQRWLLREESRSCPMLYKGPAACHSWANKINKYINNK